MKLSVSVYREFSCVNVRNGKKAKKNGERQISWSAVQVKEVPAWPARGLPARKMDRHATAETSGRRDGP